MLDLDFSLPHCILYHYDSCILYVYSYHYSTILIILIWMNILSNFPPYIHVYGFKSNVCGIISFQWLPVFLIVSSPLSLSQDGMLWVERYCHVDELGGISNSRVSEWRYCLLPSIQLLKFCYQFYAVYHSHSWLCPQNPRQVTFSWTLT